MKRVKRLIALMLMLSVLVCLVSCNAVYDVLKYFVDVPIAGFPSFNGSDEEYWSALGVTTYDEFLYCWNLKTENNPDDKKDACYTFNGVPDGYECLYYFSKPASYTTPTTDPDVYFSSVFSPGFETIIFFDTVEPCSCGNHPEYYNGVIDSSYYYRPVIMFYTPSCMSGEEIIEIEDRSLLTVSTIVEDEKSQCYYKFSYNNNEIFILTSCKKLSVEELEKFADYVIAIK